MRFDSASESKRKKRNKYNASEAGPRSEERIKNIKEKTIINYFNRLNYLEIMKKYLLFATAALALASCTNESYLGTAEELATAKGEQPISFGFNVPTPTRAEGAAAATKLNNQFIVWGEKGETDGTAAVTDGSTAKQRVFPNYKVTYGTNTAYTSTSNTKDWEYVGLSYTASGDQDFVKMAGTKVTTDVQTIKYWDYNADSYTFTAVSAKPTDISAGKVTINKLTSGTTVYDKGYEVDVTADADLNIGTANALAVCARGNRAGFCSIGTANLGIGSTDILIRTNAEVVCLVVGQVFGGVIVALCSSQLSKA